MELLQFYYGGIRAKPRLAELRYHVRAPSRDVNLECTKKWRFYLVGNLHRNKEMAFEGEEVVFSGVIGNDGLVIGTAYVRILIARSSDLQTHLFDSNRDLSSNARLRLWLVDIPVGGTKVFACPWVIPARTADIHFDVRVQIWNPHLL